MKLTYCEKCGTLITDRKPSTKISTDPLLCSGCKDGTAKSGTKRRRLSRDSGQIPRSKMTEALNLDGKKPPPEH